MNIESEQACKLSNRKNINQRWLSYQKRIADNHYYFARSCIRQNFFPASETVFLKILREELEKDIFDDPEQTTCTGIAYHSGIIPFETTMTVVARQFSLMTDAGYENFVCSCVTSFGIYTEVLETWRQFPKTEHKTREDLYKATGKTFKIPANLVHTSDIIYKYREEIAAKARYSLINRLTGKPLGIVDHVGCHYAKIFPVQGIGGAEYPQVLTGLINAWGGEQIDYPERRHCCGFGFRQYLLKENRGYSLANSRVKFESMEPFKPDAIVANCPGCTFFLDRWQYVISESEGKTYDDAGFGIPVLTYEELAGLVLGYDPWELGLQLHQVDLEPLLKRMGIVYDPAMKYKGSDGLEIGHPEPPDYLKTTVFSNHS